MEKEQPNVAANRKGDNRKRQGEIRSGKRWKIRIHTNSCGLMSLQKYLIAYWNGMTLNYSVIRESRKKTNVNKMMCWMLRENGTNITEGENWKAMKLLGSNSVPFLEHEIYTAFLFLRSCHPANGWRRRFNRFFLAFSPPPRIDGTRPRYEFCDSPREKSFAKIDLNHVAHGSLIRS